MEKDIIPVTKVNWANNNIFRSGIIPICVKNGCKWIGLGINKFSANLTVIGGSWEHDDYDLLHTATREFREEVGDNLPLVTEENLYSCYAIESKYSISIILPVDDCCFDFQPTEELHNILWVTPRQLKIMADNQEFLLNKLGRTRAYAFSTDLKLIAHRLSSIAEQDIWIPKSCVTKLARTRKICPLVAPQIYDSIEKFVKDSKESNIWGSTALVVMDNRIIIMRSNRTIYNLLRKHTSSIAKGLNRIQCKNNVSLNSDLDHPLFALIRAYAIESEMKRIDKPFDEFHAKLIRCRSTSNTTDELNIILDQEKIIYAHTLKNGTFFNERRANYFRDINSVNCMLIKHNNILPTRKLSKSLRDSIMLMVSCDLIKVKDDNKIITVK